MKLEAIAALLRDTSRTIVIFEFDDAPEELRAMSTHGGDEEEILIVGREAFEAKRNDQGAGRGSAGSPIVSSGTGRRGRRESSGSVPCVAELRSAGVVPARGEENAAQDHHQVLLRSV
jgi:hypothetical protein